MDKLKPDEKIRLEEKLIGLVRDRPFLYDKARGDYKDVIKKKNCWSEIGGLLGLNDTEQCSKIWDNLKNQHNAYIRKCKKPTGSASGKKPFFRHAEMMAFCRDGDDKESGVYSNLDESQLETFSQMELEEAGVIANDDEESVKSPVSISSDKSSDGYRPHSKYAAKRKCNAFEEELLKIAREGGDDKPSEIQSFLAHLAPKMERIRDKSPLKLTKLQIKIQQLVLEFEEEMEEFIVCS